MSAQRERFEDQIIRFGVFKDERANRFSEGLLTKIVDPIIAELSAGQSTESLATLLDSILSWPVDIMRKRTDIAISSYGNTFKGDLMYTYLHYVWKVYSTDGFGNRNAIAFERTIDSYSFFSHFFRALAMNQFIRSGNLLNFKMVFQRSSVVQSCIRSTMAKLTEHVEVSPLIDHPIDRETAIQEGVVFENRSNQQMMTNRSTKPKSRITTVDQSVLSKTSDAKTDNRQRSILGKSVTTRRSVTSKMANTAPIVSSRMSRVKPVSLLPSSIEEPNTDDIAQQTGSRQSVISKTGTTYTQPAVEGMKITVSKSSIVSDKKSNATRAKSLLSSNKSRLNTELREGVSESHRSISTMKNPHVTKIVVDKGSTVRSMSRDDPSFDDIQPSDSATSIPKSRISEMQRSMTSVQWDAMSAPVKRNFSVIHQSSDPRDTHRTRRSVKIGESGSLYTVKS